MSDIRPLTVTRRSAIKALALASASVALPAAAHDASQHGFQMVNFKRPAPAPGFALERLGGGTVDLADLRGRHILVNFWATWCPPCLKEMPSIERLHQRIPDEALTVLAISSDAEGAAIVGDFVERLGVTFTVLLDTDGKVSASYGARELPVTFILDPAGRVVAAARGERDWASEGALSYVEELVAGP